MAALSEALGALSALGVPSRRHRLQAAADRYYREGCQLIGQVDAVLLRAAEADDDGVRQSCHHHAAVLQARACSKFARHDVALHAVARIAAGEIADTPTTEEPPS